MNAASTLSALPVVAAKANPHFERFGGAAAVARLVDAFYRAMDERPDAKVIRAMHAQDLAPTRAVLVKYLSEWLGGPRQYSAERGPPRLRRVHLPFAIDAAARVAWLACMQQALDETSGDAELNRSLIQAFARIADHIHNR
jgi:hemoglobin